MIYEYKSSFDRVFKKLPHKRQKAAMDAIFALADFLEGGVKAQGLGLKQLRAYYWEIRINIRDRIIFSMIKGRVEFMMVGSHDEIRRYLKSS